MNHADIVVIGQGLAGTTLAWQLLRRGLRVMVVDREQEHSSSRIAAGLITPVTGKRLAKSWRWDELFPAAAAFYRSVEAETGTAFFHPRPSVRLFADVAERDEYHRRAAGMLAGKVQETQINEDWFAAPLGGFEMPHAARLDVPRYLDASREAFRERGEYLAADIEPARDMELLANSVRIPRLNVEAKAIALCCGFQTTSEPWFGGIRFNAAKGEILTLRVPGLPEKRVVHRGIWLSPIEGQTYRAGSTYEWDNLTPARNRSRTDSDRDAAPRVSPRSVRSDRPPGGSAARDRCGISRSGASSAVPATGVFQWSRIEGIAPRTFLCGSTCRVPYG